MLIFGRWFYSDIGIVGDCLVESSDATNGKAEQQ